MGFTCKTRSRSLNILSGETINDVPKIKRKRDEKASVTTTRNCIGVEKMAVSQRICIRRQYHSEFIVQHAVKPYHFVMTL